MSLLLFTNRSYQIQAQKSSLNYKLYQLRQDLLDLQKYAAAIADGVSLNDLSSAPSAYFGDMANYMARSHNLAVSGTEQKFAYMQASGAIPMTQDATLQQQYMNYIKSNLYEQEKEAVAKQETKLLDVKEREIQSQIKQIEDQLALIESEEKSVNDAKSKAISEATPRYVA